MQKQARSRWYPAETLTDADYTDNVNFLANIISQANSCLHSLEQGIGGIGFHINASKTKFICFKQEGAISILCGRLLKFVDKFTYLGNNISSTDSDVSVCLVKAWNAIDRL